MRYKKTMFYMFLVLVGFFSTYLLLQEKQIAEATQQELTHQKLQGRYPTMMLEDYFVPNLELQENISGKVVEEQQEIDNDNQLQQKANQPQQEENKVKEQPASHSEQGNLDFNQYVLDMIKTYDFHSVSYPYLLNEDYANYNGVTTNLVYQGKTLAKAHPNGNRASHCSGITFEVFFKAMQERNKKLGKSADDLNGLSWNQMHDLMLTWYVANGPKSQSNVAVAVEKYGIGKRITNFENARPGDFIDISRENNTGHTAVFLGWIREDNRIVGIKYWSSQSSTKGINYNQEYFNLLNGDKKYGNVRTDLVYIARIY